MKNTLTTGPSGPEPFPYETLWGGFTVVSVPDMGRDAAPDLRAALLPLAGDASCAGIALDVSAVRHMHITALGVLSEALRTLRAEDTRKGIAVCGARPFLRYNFRITRLDTLFVLADTVAEGLVRLARRLPAATTADEPRPGPGRGYAPARELAVIPAEEHTPRPLLMGRTGALLAPGEALLPHYYALRERTTGGLLCVPSPGEVRGKGKAHGGCGGAVIALYASPADAAMARRDWFRRVFSEVLCVADFPEVARVREIPRAGALDIRRAEAAARGEALPPGWPTTAPASRPGARDPFARFVGRSWPLLIAGLMLLGAWLCRLLP